MLSTIKYNLNTNSWKFFKKRVHGMIDFDNLSFWNTLNKTHQGIATASTHANFPSILHTKKLLFFYFTHSFLQNTHISRSILHIYLIKYSFFCNFLLFPHSLPFSLTYPTLSKNTKILNARTTATMHICTITVAL